MGCASSNQSKIVCIPYRTEDKGLEVVVVKKGGGWFFPKGHCQSGETNEDAVTRIMNEKAGVAGDIGQELLLDRPNVHVFPVSNVRMIRNWPEGKRKWLISARAQTEVGQDYVRDPLIQLRNRLEQNY
ncbi:hypothetical protein OROGR_003976 [Orobanche gracilis]